MGSRVIPQRSTNLAQTCLTSEIGRDRVYSCWYDRGMVYQSCSKYKNRKNSKWLATRGPKKDECLLTVRLLPIEAGNRGQKAEYGINRLYL